MPSSGERMMRATLHALGFTSSYVETSVGRTHVLSAPGQGPHGPMALLHGFAASGQQFLPLLLRLRKHVGRLIVPDLPAHGFSAPPKDQLNSKGVAAGMIETLDAVLQEPVLLFGNSMGGWAALRYTLERPEKIKRLVLCSPGGAYMSPEDLVELRKVFQVESQGAARVFIDRLLGRRSPMRYLLASSIRKSLNRPDLLELIHSVQPDELLSGEQLSALSMPILMVWGRQDGILPRKHRDFFVKHLPPGAEIIEPEGLGHSPHFDQPAVLVERIVRFLERPD